MALTIECEISKVSHIFNMMMYINPLPVTMRHAGDSTILFKLVFMFSLLRLDSFTTHAATKLRGINACTLAFHHLSGKCIFSFVIVTPSLNVQAQPESINVQDTVVTSSLTAVVPMTVDA
jgi:hypothetical protein